MDHHQAIHEAIHQVTHPWSAPSPPPDVAIHLAAHGGAAHAVVDHVAPVQDGADLGRDAVG